ncbi:MAG: PH domain-containing protein [Candidatus Nanohaloarchaea archaeon]
MTEDFDWLTLDDDEEVLWHGNPRLQRIIGLEITDFVVTNQGLYKKTGLFSRNVQKIGFDKVQNTSFSQDILGKYFGYGNVDISTAGGQGVEMRFNAIDSPKDIQEMINRRSRGSDVSTGECPECGHEIEEDWLACPECGNQVRELCDSCERLIEPGWDYCPHCASPQ